MAIFCWKRSLLLLDMAGRVTPVPDTIGGFTWRAGFVLSYQSGRSSSSLSSMSLRNGRQLTRCLLATSDFRWWAIGVLQYLHTLDVVDCGRTASVNNGQILLFGRPRPRFFK